MKLHGSIFPGFLVAAVLGAAAIRAETVPPGCWVYEALKSFELRGLTRLEPTLPYTFDQCEAYTREITANVEKERIALGPRHAYLLRRLTRQFVGLRERPEDRGDRPVYVMREGDRWAAVDLHVGGTVQRKGDQKKGEMDGLFVPDFLVSFGHNVTMESSYRLVVAPEGGSNAANEKPRARLRSYRGLTAEYERAVLDASGEWWEVRAGREYLHWGSNLREGLLLSRNAGSLDHAGARFEIGPVALSTVQATLDSGWRRRLAGHRLTVALPRGMYVGVAETVVYQRDYDYKYLIPLGIFYAQQFNEGSNADNVLWSVDWKVPLHRGLIFYGEFLIDDFQYERGDLAGPDRLGFDVTAEALFMIAGRELELAGGYTCVSQYTYGHSFGSEYVVGDGDERMNPLLGASSLGPDADRGFIKATLGVSERAALTLEGVSTRYGGGSVPARGYLRDWYPGLDNDPPFPSSPILYSRYATASLRYDFYHGSYISAGALMRFRHRNADDFHKDELLGWLEVVLDL
jgi:hypothetical protein